MRKRPWKKKKLCGFDGTFDASVGVVTPQCSDISARLSSLMHTRLTRSITESGRPESVVPALSTLAIERPDSFLRSSVGTSAGRE